MTPERIIYNTRRDLIIDYRYTLKCRNITFLACPLFPSSSSRALLAVSLWHLAAVTPARGRAGWQCRCSQQCVTHLECEDLPACSAHMCGAEPGHTSGRTRLAPSRALIGCRDLSALNSPLGLVQQLAVLAGALTFVL